MRPLALLVAVVIGVFVQCAAPHGSVKAYGASEGAGGNPLLTFGAEGTVGLHQLRAVTANGRPPAAILPESIICQPSLRWDCGSMLNIVWRESRFDNTAVNPYSGAACWFQIMPLHGYDSAVLTSDPFACTYAAYDLWLTAGYTPWRLD